VSRTSTFLVGASLTLVVGSVARRAARRLSSWGATSGEAHEAMPGDELVPDPASTTTRAITVSAPASEVWPWLVQIGTDRGGWYTHERLERLLGVPVHNASEIHPEWQRLAVGDVVELCPPGWLGTPGMRMPVVRADDGSCIVLRQEPPSSPWDGVWSFHLRAEGRGRTRVIIRSRTAVPHGSTRVLMELVSPIGTAVTWLMESGMLRGIRDRAEQSDEAVR
jgi:hypothetical protein